MGRGLAAAGAILILGGGAAIGFAVTREATGGMTPDQTSAMTAAVGKLDIEISKARTAVHTVASTLAPLQTVQLSIGTDEHTVVDRVQRGELKLSTEPGDVVELGQIVKATGKREQLFVQPAGASHVSHDGATGTYTDLMDRSLLVSEVAPVEPIPQFAATHTGYLVVTRSLDLGPALDGLVNAGITGKLVVGDKTAPIGTMPAGGEIREQGLEGAPGAKLVAAVPPPQPAMPVPILAGGIAGLVLGLVLVVLGMRKQPAQVVTPFNALPTQPTGPNAVTKYSAQQPAVAAGTPYPGDPAASGIVPQDLGPGAMIGRWEVIRRIGSGGMADVYLAQSKGEAGFEKTVAIKVMHGYLARNPRAVDHFLDEARLAARISHPNVVQIQDLGKIGNDYVIVMEYVDGVDLERMLASARVGGRLVPLDVGLGILCRICDGLNAAHRATQPDGTPLGLIHRDVKSANVLVSRQGVVKVVDFGIAKAAKQGHLTLAGETKGTPSMMAPEQRVGEQVDVRADVYSVGAVAYEILTGHGVNLDLAALAHLGIDNWPHLPLPSSLRANLPPELDQILLTAMAFDREKRPADCAAFEAIFEGVMKRNNLTASDKDISRWVEAELRQLVTPPDPAASPVKSPAV